MQDYKNFSDKELIDTIRYMDKGKYPERFKILSAELDHRKSLNPNNFSDFPEKLERYHSVDVELNKYLQRVLGLLPIIGGVLGIFAIIQLFSFELSVFAIAIYVLVSGFYLFSIVCGMYFLENTKIETLNLNRMLWVIQIPAFVIPMLGYHFFSGAYAVIAFQFSTLDVNFNFAIFGSNFNFIFFQFGIPSWLGVNLLALVISLYLTKLLNRAISKSDEALMRLAKLPKESD